MAENLSSIKNITHIIQQKMIIFVSRFWIFNTFYRKHNFCHKHFIFRVCFIANNRVIHIADPFRDDFQRFKHLLNNRFIDSVIIVIGKKSDLNAQKIKLFFLPEIHIPHRAQSYWNKNILHRGGLTLNDLSQHFTLFDIACYAGIRILRRITAFIIIEHERGPQIKQIIFQFIRDRGALRS